MLMRTHDGLLTEQELAELLRCSVAGVRAWRRHGMPARNLGRLVRYELATVLRWHDERNSLNRKRPRARGQGAA